MPYTYGTLCQVNAAYDGGLLETLDDLYAGGFQLMRKAGKYLVRDPGEGAGRYQHRIEVATYQPFFGQIVDQFASDLFEKQFEVTPAADADHEDTPGTNTVDSYYTDFAKDADGQGHSYADLARCLITTALTHRYAVLAVDAPENADGEAPKTKADEDEKGLSRLYAYELPIASLIDWERDDEGDLLWAIVRKVEQKRLTPGSSRGEFLESFTVWTLAEDGKASWERYAVRYTKDKLPKPEDEVPRVAGPVPTSFDAIPLHFLELPPGLWAGGKIGPPVLEHFRRRSSLIGAESDSLCAIPVAALGSESSGVGEAPPSVAQESPDRGDDPVGQFRARGFTVVGKDDTITFAEPSGKCYELVDKQLKELRDDIFAVCHQMAASVRTNTTALGRSGASKQADHSATARVLTALGRIVRTFSVEVWSCISAARGEDIVWSAHGLDSYEQEEREQVLEEALSTAMIPIASPTFHKLHQFKIVQQLVPSATSQEFDVIRKEIEAGVDDQFAQKDLEADAKAAATQAEIDHADDPPPGANGAPQEIVPPKVGKKQAGAEASA